MNKSVAIVFTCAPHGSAAGREGLDALLAISALSAEIAAFFVGDGVLQIVAGQQSEAALSRHHAATFKALALYDIEDVWVCGQALRERGFITAPQWVLKTTVLEPDALRAELARFDVILTF